MSEILQCLVKINLAIREMWIKMIHGGFKTYYIKDATGVIHKCTTKAYNALTCIKICSLEGHWESPSLEYMMMTIHYLEVHTSKCTMTLQRMPLSCG